MINSLILYSKSSCKFCDMAKSLLDRKNISYLENILGEDITREELLAIYPEVKSLPLIIVNGVKIGGYEQLVEWVRQQPQLLTEG